MRRNLKHLELDTVQACCEFIGASTTNKLVSIVNLDTIGTIEYTPKMMGVYAIACCWYDEQDTGAELHFLVLDIPIHSRSTLHFRPMVGCLFSTLHCSKTHF